MFSLIVLILSVCALFSLVLELDVFQPKAKTIEICLCGAPMRNGVCSVEGCVCSGKAGK